MALIVPPEPGVRGLLHTGGQLPQALFQPVKIETVPEVPADSVTIDHSELIAQAEQLELILIPQVGQTGLEDSRGSDGFRMRNGLTITRPVHQVHLLPAHQAARIDGTLGKNAELQGLFLPGGQQGLLSQPYAQVVEHRALTFRQHDVHPAAAQQHRIVSQVLSLTQDMAFSGTDKTQPRMLRRRGMQHRRLLPQPHPRQQSTIGMIRPYLVSLQSEASKLVVGLPHGIGMHQAGARAIVPHHTILVQAPVFRFFPRAAQHRHPLRERKSFPFLPHREHTPGTPQRRFLHTRSIPGSRGAGRHHRHKQEHENTRHSVHFLSKHKSSAYPLTGTGGELTLTHGLVTGGFQVAP